MIVYLEAGAVNSGYKLDQQPIVQNLGPGDLYIGTSSTSLTTTGLRLPVNAVYEFPNTLAEGAGQLWLQANLDDCDARIINVG